MTVKDLAPKEIWTHFAELNAVPRPSKKEERVIDFMIRFGESLNLETIKDKVGNVIIKKPATAGMEDRQTIVLQSHLDMVHQKNADTDFDFATQGIKMQVEGDWVSAEGTTLGADNGIGVATIMGLLASKDIPHPAIEALFTIDEETGMTGAIHLEEGLLDGTILLNLDTEDDDELTIGCAGGVDITATATYSQVDTPANTAFVKISVTGLSGGHSGMDIHKGLGNANKIMNRLLVQLEALHNIHISSVEGGSLRNAIPRESFAVVGTDDQEVGDLLATLAEQEIIIKREYATTDPTLDISAKRVDAPSHVWNGDWQQKVLRAIYACPSGIYRMSPDIDGLVQTSNNLARVHIEDGKAEILCLCRSSVDTEKADMALAISSAFELAGCEVTMSGSYPGWTPAPESDIVQVMRDLYVELFEGQPHVNACHAGLECGIIGDHYPQLDMISFGPNIRGAHSPDERVQISSVQKYWKFLLATLKRIPKKH